MGDVRCGCVWRNPAALRSGDFDRSPFFWRFRSLSRSLSSLHDPHFTMESSPEKVRKTRKLPTSQKAKEALRAMLRPDSPDKNRKAQQHRSQREKQVKEALRTGKRPGGSSRLLLLSPAPRALELTSKQLRSPPASPAKKRKSKKALGLGGIVGYITCTSLPPPGLH